MKFEVKEASVDFYNEFLSILFSINKIKKNYHLKINDVYKVGINNIIVQVVFILATLLLIDYIPTNISFSIIFIFVFLIILNVIVLIDFKTKLKDYLKNNNASTISIDEIGIELIELSKTCKINYNSIEVVLINKHSICVIPKDMTGIMIGIPIEYKDQFLEGVKDYNQSLLIIDNVSLYK